MSQCNHPNNFYVASDGSRLCKACYDASQPWRVDAGTRENYESALLAIRGGGYGASAEMIEAYVKELQSETVRDKA